MAFSRIFLKQILYILLFLFPFLHAHGDEKRELSFKFKGLKNSQLLKDIKQIHQASQYKYQASLKLTAIHDLVEQDKIILSKFLRSRAYLEHEISSDIREYPTSRIVEFYIDKGPQYLFSEVDIPNISQLQSLINDKHFPIQKNKPAHMQDVLEAEKTILNYSQSKGYPWVKILKKELLADYKNKEVRVIFEISFGPLARFSKTDISGLKRVKRKFLSDKILWKEGELFDIEKVKLTKQQIEESGLFVLSHISYPTSPTEDALVPMEITVKESKHRTLSLGLSYSTPERFGFSYEWENRNVSKQGEVLEFRGLFSNNLDTSLGYKKREFLQKNQNLHCLLAFKQGKFNKDIYEINYKLAAILERKIAKSLHANVSLQIERFHASGIDNPGFVNTLSLPFSLHWNYLDRQENPRSGNSHRLKFSPYLNTQNQQHSFLVQELSLSHYTPLTKRSTGLIWIHAGSIIGGRQENIPVNKRFFGGSGKYLRGYKYHSVSPLDAEYRPIGGRSLLVMGMELRFKTFDTIQTALFYEMGSIESDNYPRLKKPLSSLGMGFHYLTPIGPIKLELALPLVMRKKIDGMRIDKNKPQIYLNMGYEF